LPLKPQPAHLSCVPVLSNRQIVPEIFLLNLEEPRLAEAACAGQFVMLSIPNLRDPLLPRPFAVFNVDGRCVEILYKRVGKGTGLLSQMREGDLLTVLGPLGNGFSLPEDSVTALVLAGGIGIASVHFLLVQLLKRRSGSTTLLYGVRSHEELIPLKPLEEKGLLIRIATEDGRRGMKGTVTELLATGQDPANELTEGAAEAFVCGPLAMLKAVAGQMEALGIRGHFSLESRMACGYGVCQGCVVPFRSGNDPQQVRYRKVCTEGPVFSAEEICWEEIRE
jgi:dihydroorotate dehydrogenase electron transfer subunit